MNALENYLERLHATYEAQGRAVVAKVPTPGEPRQVRGKLLYRKAKACWTDYTGFMLAGGRAIVLEAKATGIGLDGTEVNPTSFPLSRLAHIQRKRLFQAAKANAIGALYIRRIVPGIRVLNYLVPAKQGSALYFVGQVQGKKSIKWAAMEPWRIPPGCTWLDAVVEGRCAEFRWPAYKRGGWAAIEGPVSSASVESS